MSKRYKYKCKWCGSVIERSSKRAWFLSFCGNVEKVVRVYAVRQTKKKVKGK